jgi:hypothetical protein
MNGEEYSLAEFSRLAAYVQQDDVLFGGLTVRGSRHMKQRPSPSRPS